MSPQFSIAHYRVTAKLGEGGMGAVYRATDTKLHRDVAIKVLPDSFAADPDRLARFTREAHVLASLNHPNIAQIYGVEDRALVMELVAGETLAGPLPPEQALRYARQIAGALAAAHDKGIVHRDLKSANIMVTADDTIKVLDFGLAKAGAAEPVSTANSPTLTIAATNAGVILGTAAYMSPEQARGKTVDRRADIWAFGVVFYEMLAGTPAFSGESVPDILAGVLTRDPDWRRVPERFRPLLRKCLEKDPAKRLRDIGDFELLLAESAPAKPAPRRLPYAAAALAAAALTASSMYFWMRPAAVPATGVTRFTIPLAPDEEALDTPAISPDGRVIAYVTLKAGAGLRLFLRQLSAFQSRDVAGAAGAWQPFFSSDGAWLGFFSQGQLQKVAVTGGSPVKIASAPAAYGGTFLDDGSIVYVPDEAAGLMWIRPGASASERLTTPDNGENGYSHVWPQALPGGEHILFSVFGKKHGLAVLSLKTRRWQFVLPKQTAAVPGDIAGSSIRLFVSDGGAGVKTGSLNFSKPAAISADAAALDNVNLDAMGAHVRLGLAVSRSGTAVYFPGNSDARSLVWMDREGRASTAVSLPTAYQELALSPDGTKAAVLVNQDVWVYELPGGAHHRLTFYADTGSNATSVAWSPDSARVVFSAIEGADYDMYSQQADGSRPAERLLRRPGSQFPTAVRADGAVLFGEASPGHGESLYSLLPDGKVMPVHVTDGFNAANAVFSPDGRRVAYQSDETGRPEIYVEDYPGGGHRASVSTEGGYSPIWSRDGRELFYISATGVMAAPVAANGSFGPARKLFDSSTFYIRWHSYDPGPDGRLLFIRRDPAAIPRQVNVILNWREELDRLAAAR